MAAHKSTPIIVKRVKKRGGGGHHGGSWKIAYADFVTAMMAFFLLMWLLGSTSKGDLEGIAEYFQTPLRVALQGGSGSGDSSSVIHGGGEDLSRTVGQVHKSETPGQIQTINLQKARDTVKRKELEELRNLKRKFEQAIRKDPKLAPFRDQIRLDLTAEGLEIQIVDDMNRPMFDTGRDVLKSYTRDILHAMGGLLNGVDHAISLAGHTDSAPYALGERGYSNWELSADRANAARRELVAGGMDESKVLRVVGLSSSLPLDAKDPLDPINRRISLVVLNDATERAIRGEAPLPAVSIQGLEDAARIPRVATEHPGAGTRNEPLH